jgi:hypothetical protein
MNPADPIAAWLKAWPGALGSAGAGSPLDALLVQAHVASSASLLRAGQRGSESWMEFVRTPADAPLAERVDAARGHLRRLGEIAADEARQLAQQLAALDEQARALVDAGATADEPARRARAKP